LAHGSQVRKFTFEPYYFHPICVAQIVWGVCQDEEVIAAALCHDLIEDTQTAYQDIYSNFGERVADLVLEVTDVSIPEDGNRGCRKQIDRDHLAQASPHGQTIKLADLIDNTKSIVEHDPDFAVQYLAEKKALLQILTKGNMTLWEQALKQVIEGENRLVRW
jgi:(p)ppGpp synthase/HD superfamily hydrolase